jgi:FKBP-type peptidyl-prolyl cis-trans isomerase FkpA
MKNKFKTIFLSFLIIILIFLVACNNTDEYKKYESQQIQNYLNSLGDTTYALKPSGLYYIELFRGFGRMPVIKDTVSIRYEATYVDRAVFTSNYKDSLATDFIVGSRTVIPGIDEGVRYMKEGGRSRLVIPSGLGYGNGGLYGYLPAYTPLIWQIDLVKVRAGSKK